MKKYWLSFIILVYCILAPNLDALAEVLPEYFGLEAPGADPVRFTPHVLNNLGERIPANPEMSPDYQHFFFSLVDSKDPDSPVMTIMYSHRGKDGWSKPVEADFLKMKGFNMAEPFFSRDGKNLYFQSNRPPGKPIWNVKAFVSELNNGQFSKPEYVPINDENQGVWYPFPAKDGSIYFSSNLKDSVGKTDLYKASKDSDGKYTKVSNLGSVFNTEHTEWDPYLNNEENRLIFVSDKPGGYGEVDVYMSQLDENKQWGKAINLGKPINSELYDTAAKLSPDGRFLFFQRIINDKEVIFWVDFNLYLKKHNLL